MLNYPGSRGPFSKYLNEYEINRREPSVSIRKKYALEPRVMLNPRNILNVLPHMRLMVVVYKSVKISKALRAVRKLRTRDSSSCAVAQSFSWKADSLESQAFRIYPLWCINEQTGSLKPLKCPGERSFWLKPVYRFEMKELNNSENVFWFSRLTQIMPLILVLPPGDKHRSPMESLPRYLWLSRSPM